MTAGFVHGVLNTDNINISGESFDYGPYRFLPEFDPNFTAAYFDTRGLYCFGRQPSSFLWNLEQLKKCLVHANPGWDWDLNLNYAKYFQFHLIRRFLLKLHIQPKTEHPTFKVFLSKGKNPLKNNFSLVESQHFPFILDQDQIECVLTCDEFQKSQELLDLFYNWLENNTHLKYEEGFFTFCQKIHNIKNEIPPTESFSRLQQHVQSYFQPQKTDSTLQTTDFLNYLQFSTPETLLINEIESIWEEIDSKDDWSLFENKLKKLNSLNKVYNF